MPWFKVWVHDRELKNVGLKQRFLKLGRVLRFKQLVLRGSLFQVSCGVDLADILFGCTDEISCCHRNQPWTPFNDVSRVARLTWVTSPHAQNMTSVKKKSSNRIRWPVDACTWCFLTEPQRRRHRWPPGRLFPEERTLLGGGLPPLVSLHHRQQHHRRPSHRPHRELPLVFLRRFPHCRHAVIPPVFGMSACPCSEQSLCLHRPR